MTNGAITAQVVREGPVLMDKSFSSRANTDLRSRRKMRACRKAQSS